MEADMIAMWLGIAALIPVLLSGLFVFLQKKTPFSRLPYIAEQGIIGLAFGGAAVLATLYGVPAQDGIIMNVRDAAPFCAGLLFGSKAGLIAGLIGGMHRWMIGMGSGADVTRAACALATLLAGACSGLMRRKLFEDSRPGVLSAFGLGATMEVLHMLLILALNLRDVSHAFVIVQTCAFPMIVATGFSVAFATLVCRFTRKPEKIDIKNKKISHDFAFWLLICVVIAFVATSGFTQQIIYRITDEDAALYRSVTLYLVVFMEILIYTALFILVYEMLKKKVVRNLALVNEGLSAITAGNLDTVVDVRAYKEFSELSDHVNETISTLKHYIKKAEERIDRELEFARQIQLSALPSVFPPYPQRPDFDLYASMEAAKEVGGDFYDFYMLDRYTLVFMIADVSGKGIPAAMFMMTAKTLIKGLAESRKPVDEILTEANRRLCETNDAGMFITAWMGKIDLRTGLAEFANAGHNPPLVCRRDGEFEYLRARPNFILAGMEQTRYRRYELQMAPGDRIFLYTDGITEANNTREELYGEERLQECLKGSRDKPMELCKKVEADVKHFAEGAPQSDDMTMLCLQLNAVQEPDTMTTHPDADSLTIMQTFIDDRLTSAGVSKKVQNRMQVAADEIWSNIIRYSGAQSASLKLLRQGDTLLARFTDDGRPFDPTQTQTPDVTLSAEDRPIGGLGLHMVRKMTISMTYEYADGKNCLTLGFAL